MKTSRSDIKEGRSKEHIQKEVERVESTDGRKGLVEREQCTKRWLLEDFYKADTFTGILTVLSWNKK